MPTALLLSLRRCALSPLAPVPRDRAARPAAMASEWACGDGGVAPPRDSFPNGRVLLIDGDAAARDATARLLEACGYEVSGAGGRHRRAFLRSSELGCHPAPPRSPPPRPAGYPMRLRRVRSGQARRQAAAAL